MIIGIPKETFPGERRVAVAPENVQKFCKLGYEVVVEASAGSEARLPDVSYEEAGASVLHETTEVWAKADLVMKIRPPSEEEVSLLKEGATLISFIQPAQNEELVKSLAERKVNAIAMDCVPRISRAQSMDALSSMANVAGYRAMVEAAHEFGRFFTGQITAAGKVPPAKVLVIGAGVAGLSAIGTARNMGAIVRAFDTRPAVKEEVESLGAEFLELDFEEEGSGTGGYAKVMSKEFIEAEMALFAEQAKEVDIIITTALIPGKPAPELILEDMVMSMKDGSVIVDLAAERGGNCKLSEAGKVVKVHGVSIIGYTDLPSRMAAQSSQLYGTNLRHLLTDMCPNKDGNVVVDFDDEVVRGATVVKNGEITFPPPAPKLSAAPAKPAEPAPPPVEPKEDKPSWVGPALTFGIGALGLVGLGAVAPASFMAHFTVFVLACFVGYMVVWNVTAALHTPLMSVTNAISSIIVLGAILQISSGEKVIMWVAVFAVLITSINIVGGFAVTRRMLEMFRK